MSVKPVFPDEIFTPRLILSRPRPTDFADLRRFATNEQVMATLGGVQTEEQTRVALERHLDHWQRHGFGWWMMRDQVGGAFIGRGGLRHFVVAGRERGRLFCRHFTGLAGEGRRGEEGQQGMNRAA
jgi:RimJ/RimL family protein N-acetyltransferase